MDFKIIKVNRPDREKYIGFTGQLGCVGNRLIITNENRHFVTAAVKKITIETANTIYELEVIDNETCSC